MKYNVVEDNWYGGYAVTTSTSPVANPVGVSRWDNVVARGCLKSVAEAIARRINRG